MSAFAMNTRVTTISALAYRDAPAAIRWLCDNFGFVYPAHEGRAI